jgi:hypothetical protein
VSGKVQERDLSNAQAVGINGLGVVTVAMPRARMTREEALVHAAWLILIAGGELEIRDILSTIGGES